MKLPLQLQNKSFRFIKIRPGKKVPSEEDWPMTNNYKYNDPDFIEYLKTAKAYGVACGFGQLAIIDCDNTDSAEKIMAALPDTFTVLTPGHESPHLYFIIKDLTEKIVMIDSNKIHHGEVQFTGAQALGPGSIHPNKKRYTILKDIPIAHITKEELLTAIKPFIKPDKECNTGKDMDISPIAESIEGLKLKNGELVGVHPIHGSEGGSNFRINENTNRWHCFRCPAGGDALSLVALLEGIVPCEKLVKGYFSTPEGKAVFPQVVKAAKKKYGYRDKSTKKNNIKRISKLIYKNVLYEQIYDPESMQSKFICLKSGKLEIKDKIKTDYFEYLPLIGEELEKGNLLLTKTAKEYVGTKELIEEIMKFSYKYVDIPEDFRQKAAWYVLLTWIADRLNTVPYLRFLGDYGAGKTRDEDTFGGLCYKPSRIGGAARAAPIYRIMDKWHGTLIFDEFVLKQSDDSKDIVQILNNGFQKNMHIVRCDSKNYENVRYFDPFGPKIIGARKGFDDRALESRCITAYVEEKERQDIPRDLGKTFFKERDQLREKLLMYRLKNWHTIDPESVAHIDFGNLESRIEQTYLPFFVLFNNDKEVMESFILQAGKENERLIDENVESFDGQLVNEFFDRALKDKECKHYITAEDLSTYLEMTKKVQKMYCGSRAVGKHMRSLGFEYKMQRKSKNIITRAYQIPPRKAKKLAKRYVINEEILKKLQKRIKQRPKGEMIE